MQITSERFDIARSLRCVTYAFGSYRGDDDGGHSDVNGVGKRGDGLVHHVHLDAKVKQMPKFQTFQKQYVAMIDLLNIVRGTDKVNLK